MALVAYLLTQNFYKLRKLNWQNQQDDCAPSEDSDQPGHLPSLIRVFAVRMKKAWVLSYQLSAKRRLWSDWADAQADLSLRWAHMPLCWFCHEAAQLFYNNDNNYNAFTFWGWHIKRYKTYLTYCPQYICKIEHLWNTNPLRHKIYKYVHYITNFDVSYLTLALMNFPIIVSGIDWNPVATVFTGSLIEGGGDVGMTRAAVLFW